MNARTHSLAALTLVLMAAACSSSSPGAAPKSTSAPTKATTTTAAVPTVPGIGPIKLVSETGVSPEQLHRAETLLAKTIIGLKRFASPAQAYAAGYRTIGDSITGDEHYVNWSYSNDGHILDPARPESIVYEWKNGKQTAVAAMYALPLGSSFAAVPDVGGSLTQWHVHRYLCLTEGAQQRFVSGLTTESGGCPPGTDKAGNTPMLHVWNIRTPCGPFSALEGVGAGQVPEGQTRNCDTRNASVP